MIPWLYAPILDQPTSSAMMTTMLGFFAVVWATTVVHVPSAITATATGAPIATIRLLKNNFMQMVPSRLYLAQDDEFLMLPCGKFAAGSASFKMHMLSMATSKPGSSPRVATDSMHHRPKYSR